MDPYTHPARGPLAGMRAFVAVEVPPVVLDGTPTGSDAQPAHITLQFLGEVSPGQVVGVESALRSVGATTAPIGVEMQGVGAFPGPARPRVTWVGVGRGKDQLVELARRVGEALAPVGFRPEPRAFIPHVTLFRVRSAADATRARALLDQGPTGPLASGTISELLLKESLLSRTGAVHRVVSRVALVGPHTP
ncbi:MAG: RNA 2',3'-cyclic phosphodiesterase [Thermoplasmata archaeon]|nr:RNA 2',3'-cyclic phosphodiesterase [Thermoplasmata archaeon]